MWSFIGFFLVLALGTYLTVAGGLLVWVNHAFGGRSEKTILIPVVIGLGMLAFCWYFNPVSLDVNIR